MNLRELSRTLGLLQTTVSRALNGYPEVSEATRRRVQEAAKRHDYRPSQRAKSLATGRSMSIADVIPVSSRHEMVNPVFADFIAGASEVYAAAGYDIALMMAGTTDEATIYRDIAARHRADGVIVHAPRRNDPRLALLRDLGLPFVVHGRFLDETDGYSWLDMNNRRAFDRATRHLLDLGHRRIALVNGLADMDFAIRRHAGYAAALERAGIAIDPALVRCDEMTEHFGHDAASALLDGADPPTAFLSSSLIIALGLRRACEERGLRVGQEVSIVTHDDGLSYFRNGVESPIFTALRSPVRDHGRICAQILLQLVADSGDPSDTPIAGRRIAGGPFHRTGPAP